MTEEIDDLSYVKYALSLSSVLPEGIPEDFLPENITSLMHSKNWARVIINVRSAGESDDAFNSRTTSARSLTSITRTKRPTLSA
ncbi:MAG: hypothetical protein ACLT4C_01480 [Butyricicoccus sp.]